MTRTLISSCVRCRCLVRFLQPLIATRVFMKSWWWFATSLDFSDLFLKQTKLMHTLTVKYIMRKLPYNLPTGVQTIKTMHINMHSWYYIKIKFSPNCMEPVNSIPVAMLDTKLGTSRRNFGMTLNQEYGQSLSATSCYIIPLAHSFSNLCASLMCYTLSL